MTCLRISAEPSNTLHYLSVAGKIRQGKHGCPKKLRKGLEELIERSKHEKREGRLQGILDEATDPWGIKVSAVTIKDVSLPEEMLRAMAKQAEAERERRARVIIAKGELEAAAKMSEAAKLYQKEPASLRLRELQTLTEIAREKNLVVVTPSQLGASIGEVAGVSSALRKTLEKKD